MKKNDLYGIVAIVGIVAAIFYYTLQGSNLYFPVLKILLLINVICGFFLLIINIKKINPIFLIVFLFLVLLYFNIKDTRLLISFFSIICSINVSHKKMVKSVFYSYLVSFLFALITGGYHNINGVALHFFVFLLLYTYLFKEEKKYLNKIISLILYLVFCFITKSGALIICGALYLFFIFTENKKINSKLINSKFIVYIFLYCLIFNLLGAIFINVTRFPFFENITPSFIETFLKNIFTFVDSLTSYRIQLANFSLFIFGVSLFGGNVDYNLLPSNEYYFNLDSGYMWLLQGFGIVITLLFLYYTVFILKNSQKHKDKYIMYIAIVFALYAINEDILLSVGFNILFLLSSKYLCYNSKIKKKVLK